MLNFLKLSLIIKSCLVVEEWDVGCSTVGNARIANFEVINRGGEGRFWLLTEEEFLNEVKTLANSNFVKT